jgi:hypothetical protein
MVLRECEVFCNVHRPHCILKQAALLRSRPFSAAYRSGPVPLRLCDCAGGMIHEYHLVAYVSAPTGGAIAWPMYELSQGDDGAAIQAFDGLDERLDWSVVNKRIGSHVLIVLVTVIDPGRYICQIPDASTCRCRTLKKIRPRQSARVGIRIVASGGSTLSAFNATRSLVGCPQNLLLPSIVKPTRPRSCTCIYSGFPGPAGAVRKSRDVDDMLACKDPRALKLAAAVLPEPLRQTHQIGTIKLRSSKTEGKSYLSNGCFHCNALMGNFFLYYRELRDAIEQRGLAGLTKIAQASVAFQGVRPLLVRSNTWLGAARESEPEAHRIATDILTHRVSPWDFNLDIWRPRNGPGWPVGFP